MTKDFRQQLKSKLHCHLLSHSDHLVREKVSSQAALHARTGQAPLSAPPSSRGGFMGAEHLSLRRSW